MTITTAAWILLITFTGMVVLEIFSQHHSRRFRRTMAQALREYTDHSQDLVLLIEDIIRIEPESEEALAIARLELISNTQALRKIADRLERKRWWT